jgi:hypothetical protein
MPWTPVWSKLRAVAHTLPYDLAIVKDHQRGNPLTFEEFSSVAAPTLVLAGGKSPAWMRHGMQALASVLGDARLRTLAGQTHMVKPAVVAPVITDFFTAS